MKVQSTFQIVVTQNFEVHPKYSGLDQERLNWLLENIFWCGTSTDDGNFILTFYLPLPPEQEFEELAE